MFITTCFIRKNTPELRSKLGKMGYYVCHCTEGATAVFLMALLGEVHAVCDEDVDMFLNDAKSVKYELIDCGDDEQLFLALAAMRDDSDYMQYFTNGHDFIMCDREDWVDMYSVLCSGRGKEYQDVLDNYHKATREEIINCFSSTNRVKKGDVQASPLKQV